jgi:hypothetical protein
MSADKRADPSTRSSYGSDDRRVPGGSGGDCDCCSVAAAQSAREKQGLAWVIGAFAICPCHLPLTLAVLAAVSGGTAAGTALRAHPIAAGAIITSTWAVATWHGLRLMGKPAA